MVPVRGLAFLAAACSLLGRSTNAQVQTTTKVTTPARVALVAVNSLPDGQRVRVIRRPHAKPQDIILVAPAAASLDLAAALHVYNGLRFQYGDSLRMALEASPGGYVPSPNWSDSPYQSWINAQLSRLRSARVFRVQGVGTNRAVWITLPAPSGQLEVVTPSVRK